MNLEKIYEVVSIEQKIKKTRQELIQIKSPDDVSKYANKIIGNKTKEHLLIIMLNTKNQIIASSICHVGSINASIVSPRDVYQTLLLNNCCSYIVCHNHPSTVLLPSNEDIQVSRRLAEAGKILGIELLDHLIVGNGNYISLKQKGYFE